MAGVADRALLVDLDGTIWDSATWYPLVVGAEAGCSPDVPRSALIGGRPIASVLHDHGITESRFRRLCAAPPVALVVHDDVRETLARLRDRGVGLAAVTNLPLRIASPMLAGAGLGALLTVVEGASRTRRGKPHPDPLWAALTSLGVEATPDSWYVGDMPEDQQAAASAGLSFAWAGYATNMPAPAGSDATLARFADVEALVG